MTNQTKNCNICGTTMQSDADVCPSCGAIYKKDNSKLIANIITAVIVVVAGIILVWMFFASEDSTISKKEFDSLENGMSYRECVEIIGCDGELMSKVNITGFGTSIYSWKGRGFWGANANATFQNGKLVGKAQVGLW